MTPRGGTVLTMLKILVRLTGLRPVKSTPVLRRLGLFFYKLSDLIWFISYDWDWERHYITTGEERKKNIIAKTGESFALWLFDAGTYLQRSKHDS